MVKYQNGYDVHHKDGNKLNNSIFNLELIERGLHHSQHNFGKKFTEEHKERLRRANTNNPIYSKKVIQTTENDEFIKIWDSAAEAGRNGFCKQCISYCCKGKIKTHKGFKFKFYDGE